MQTQLGHFVFFLDFIRGEPSSHHHHLVYRSLSLTRGSSINHWRTLWDTNLLANVFQIIQNTHSLSDLVWAMASTDIQTSREHNKPKIKILKINHWQASAAINCLGAIFPSLSLSPSLTFAKTLKASESWQELRADDTISPYSVLTEENLQVRT